jgi:hypothetical protein
MSTASREKTLTTADLAAARERPIADAEENTELNVESGTAEVVGGKHDIRSEEEQLAPLFTIEAANGFRSRWDAVQSSFVDDPRQAVRHGDELVAQVMKSLAETFSKERASLEGQLDRSDAAATENLRVALRRYRSFFKRLLSL